MYFYLAQPIDQFTQAESVPSPLTVLVAHIREAARQQQHSLYRPGRAHVLPGKPWEHDDMAIIARINQIALYESHGVIAVLLPGIPTLGVPAEIEEALTLNRPTLILTTHRLRSGSVQIANWVSRGANCVLVGEDGHLEGINLAQELGSLPDPTRLFEEDSTVELVGLGPLMVRYDPTFERDRQTLTRGKYEGDAGIDLAIVHDEPLAANEYRMLPTGAHVAIPEGYFGLITGRSSTWARYRCDVRQAVIDSGYRGELMIGVENRGAQAMVFEAGTRLAQIVLLPVWGGKIEVTDRLPDHERGEAGYGSSGQ